MRLIHIANGRSESPENAISRDRWQYPETDGFSSPRGLSEHRRNLAPALVKTRIRVSGTLHCVLAQTSNSAHSVWKLTKWQLYTYIQLHNELENVLCATTESVERATAVDKPREQERCRVSEPKQLPRDQICYHNKSKILHGFFVNLKKPISNGHNV